MNSKTKNKSIIISILLISSLLLYQHISYAQVSNDAFFYEQYFQERELDINHYAKSGNIGLSFNNFNTPNSEGMFFDDFDLAPDNASVGNGLICLSTIVIMYSYLKRKENKK